MSLPSEVIVFFLNNQAYAIDISAVQEIRSYQYPDKRRGSPPEYLLGTVDLRGTNLSIIDLRLYARVNADLNAFTAVLVLKEEDWLVGVTVDQVSNVTDYTLCQLSGEVASLPLCDYIVHTVSTPNIYPVSLLDHRKLLQVLKREIAL